MAPTAISSTVVAAMIGANIASLTLFTLLGNLLTALLLPLLLPLLGITGDMPFFMSFWFILRQLFSMLIAPLIGVLLLSRFLPRIYREVRKRRGISFYLWIISFAVVIARSTDFFLTYSGGNIHAGTSIIAGSLAFFMFQFLLGRNIGSLYDERLTGGQAMGHKNTVLAIWIAQSYMQPLASIGPTGYILWQAVVNGWQVWRYQSKKIRK
jgi:BASS family bile acid:Na+ symporter